VSFIPTEFDSAWLIKPAIHEDHRGFFARTWCRREFEEHGLESEIVQCSVSFNISRATLRGMHFQAHPHEEAKLVRCTQGAMFDVIVDLRKDSPTFGKWQGFELSSTNRLALYVPKGFAHGFQTLHADTEVLYQMTEFFNPEVARAFHYADPAVGINWPLPVKVISRKDASSPPLHSLLFPADRALA